jgi:methyl-accepting chemotaxis protein
VANARSLISKLARPLLEAPVRERVEEAIDARGLVKPGAIRALRAGVAELVGEPAQDPQAARSLAPRLDPMAAEVAALAEKLTTATAAIQATANALADTRRIAADALTAAREASDRAAAATRTAEAAAEQVSSLEDRIQARNGHTG